MDLIIEILNSSIISASIFEVAKLSICNIIINTSIKSKNDCTFILIILLGDIHMISFLVMPLKFVWKSINFLYVIPSFMKFISIH